MATLGQSLQEAQLLLQEAEKSRDALKQQMADEEDRPAPLLSGADAVAPIMTPELDARLSTLTKNLDDMLLRYTDSHPDVLNTRRIVKEVEAQREAERKRLAEESDRRKRAAAASPQNPVNPVYPQLKLAMAEAEAQVARLGARVRDHEQRLAQMRTVARSVPEREALLTQLNRDYTIQKQNYDALVVRRESALISSEAQAATGVANFRIIDPPQVAPDPILPHRKMLIALAVLASVVAGLAASYFFSLVYPTFHDARRLKTFAGRPMLGTVSLIRNPQIIAAARRRTLLFCGGLGGLAATYLSVLTVVFLRTLLPF
jgi:polysaccharide chain length determinant protein (PEP-CTERM system associated)